MTVEGLYTFKSEVRTMPRSADRLTVAWPACWFRLRSGALAPAPVRLGGHDRGHIALTEITTPKPSNRDPGIDVVDEPELDRVDDPQGPLDHAGCLPTNQHVPTTMQVPCRYHLVVHL